MKKVIFLIFLATIIQVQAESLFSLNASQSNIIEPKPLFSSVRARNVGDLVSIIVEETATVTDTGTYATSKSSSLAKNVTKIWSLVSKSNLADAVNNANDGELSVDNSTEVERNIKMVDKISAQVVQVLPNGNLLVQGKKTLVSQNERMDIVISGIIDPKWIDQSGEIASSHVANLQFAMSGNGTVSRGQNEGIVNKVVRTIF